VGGLEARLMKLLCEKKNYSELQIKSGRTFEGGQCLKKVLFANDDDEYGHP
jgi:hypothetical protein